MSRILLDRQGNEIYNLNPEKSQKINYKLDKMGIPKDAIVQINFGKTSNNMNKGTNNVWREGDWRNKGSGRIGTFRRIGKGRLIYIL